MHGAERYDPGKRARSTRARELANRSRDAAAAGDYDGAERLAREAFRVMAELDD